jgi:hypothetical protein
MRIARRLLSIGRVKPSKNTVSHPNSRINHECVCRRVKSIRENVRELVKDYNKTEDDLKALQVHIRRANWSLVRFLT